MRTNFLEKICAKCGGETSSRLNLSKFVFIACVSRGIQKY